MGVSKLAHIPNITLRAKAKIPRIATLIKICRLRWLGHVWRMPDVRLPKQVLFGELNNGKRPQHKPKVRWRDCITKDIKDVKLSSTWPNLTMNREKWRTEVKQRCAEHNSKLDEDDKKRRAIHKDDGYADEGCKCHICGQRVTSDKYLKSHITQKHNEAAKQRRMCQRQQQHTEQINSLMCLVPDCRFIPANQKGCKIHLRRKHSWSAEIVKNFTFQSTPTIPIPTTSENPEIFHCPSLDCTFISGSSNGLKIHLRIGPPVVCSASGDSLNHWLRVFQRNKHLVIFCMHFPKRTMASRCTYVRMYVCMYVCNVCMCSSST